MSFKTYYKLTKPGIIFGNAVTAGAGYALASQGHILSSTFLSMLVGLSLIIASACVFNNYSDRAIDQKMHRTKSRALAKGSLSVTRALFFATLLGALGTLTLSLYTNYLTLALSLLGFFVYLVLYRIWKYRSTHGTLVGSIAGAIPPVVGYCAVTNQLDLGALLVFSIVMLWQMPHFFAIAIFRYDDYRAASIPVLPVIKGMKATKVQILLYTIAFIIAAMLPTFFGYTGYVYLLAAAVLGTLWLVQSVKGFSCKNDKVWAHQMFRTSLVVITTLCIMMSLDVR